MATSRISTELTDNTPRSGLLSDFFLQLHVGLFTIGQQRGQHRRADHLAKRRLGDSIDCLTIVGDGQRSLLGIVHVPEDDCVDVDRYRVLRQRRLGIESGGLDTLIDDRDHRVEDGDDRKQTRPSDALQLAEPQDNELLPNVGHFQRRGDQDGARKESDRNIQVDEVTGRECRDDEGKHQK